MRMKHFDPTVQSNRPYEFCYTGRQETGNALTMIINNMELGGTIFINGEWGSGKTTFLRMWRQSLIDAGYPTVHLNSWETEWAEDPLIAVIANIYAACNKKRSEETLSIINGVIKKFVRKPLPIVGSILETVIKSKFDVDLESILGELKDLSTTAFDDAVDSFIERSKCIKSLKLSLEKLAWEVNQEEDNNKPLVFIIDELDRCKPDYAVRMLEVLKHFFEVKNIVFVCAIDKKHLEVSIKGFYGSNELNSSEYLRRFYDLEVDLPKPNYELFCKHLYEYYELGLFFDSKDRVSMTPLFQNNGNDFIKFLGSLANKSNMTLRQVDRICAFTKITLQGKKKNIYYYPQLSLFVTYLCFFDQSFYQDLYQHNLSSQDILDRIIDKYRDMIDIKDVYDHSEENNHSTMLIMICRLVVAYNNDRLYHKEKIYDPSSGTTTLKPNYFEQKDLNSAIKWLYDSNYDYRLEWLFKVLNILKLND